MKPNKEANKPRITYRYYELPEGELVQAITGEDWVCTYGTYAEDVHFHNVMEIGICRWGQGLMVLEDQRIDYTDGAVTVVPANCLHTTLSRDKSLNSWEYLFFDPAGILNSAFPNDPLFVESVLHRLSSEALCLPQEDAVELERLITMVLNECQTKHEYHKAVEQNLMTSLLLLITRSYTEKKTHIRPMTVGLQQIIPAIEYIGMHYMNPISGEDLASICSLSEAQLRRMVFFLAGLQNIDYSVYEAAKIDGANGWQTFWKITVPLLMPTIVMTAIMSINGTLQLFDESVNLTNGGPANATITMSHYIYNNSMGQGVANFGYASALSFVIFVMVAILSFISMKAGDKRD